MWTTMPSPKMFQLDEEQMEQEKAAKSSLFCGQEYTDKFEQQNFKRTPAELNVCLVWLQK